MFIPLAQTSFDLSKCILAVHACVDLLAVHEIDIDEAEAIGNLCYGDAMLFGMELTRMLVGETSRPRLHKQIEADYVMHTRRESGWSTQVSIQTARECYASFLQEVAFINEQSSKN